MPKHPEARLWPSEVVTLGRLHALKGGGNRPFYRWLTRDYRPLFPRLPERTRSFVSSRPTRTGRRSSGPDRARGIDTYGIALIHPMRAGRSPHQIGRKGLSNHRWIVGETLGIVASKFTRKASAVHLMITGLGGSAGNGWESCISVIPLGMGIASSHVRRCVSHSERGTPHQSAQRQDTARCTPRILSTDAPVLSVSSAWEDGGIFFAASSSRETEPSTCPGWDPPGTRMLVGQRVQP
jgi:hypothetical protein